VPLIVWSGAPSASSSQGSRPLPSRSEGGS
jgi:hypothetical protein